jgi:hypothetical protein
MFPTLVGVLLVYLWALIQWLLETAIYTSTYVAHEVARFPTYVYDSFLEAASNWYQFFSSDLPSFFCAFYTTGIWLKDAGENTITYLDDAYDEVTQNLYDTFGNPIGDLTHDDWVAFYQSIMAFATMFAVCCVLKWYWEHHGEDSTLPQSPTIAAEEGQHVPNMTCKDDANERTPPRPRPSNSHPPAEKYTRLPEHLKLTGYFRTPRPDQPFGRTIHTHEKSLNDGSRRVKRYGYWRSVSGQSTEDVEDDVQVPIPKPAQTQHPIVAKAQLSEPVQASTPPHMRMDIVSSPPGLVQPLPAPATKAPHAMSPLKVLTHIFAALHVDSNVLRGAMDTFFEGVVHGEYDYRPPGAFIWDRLGHADAEFAKVLPNGFMPFDCATAFHWRLLVQDFWNKMQPHGYLITSHADEKVRTLLERVYVFGLSLHLDLQLPDPLPPAAAPPPPPQEAPAPPKSQGSATTQPAENIQAASKLPTMPAQAASETPGNVFDFMPSNVRLPARPAASRIAASRAATSRAMASKGGISKRR